MKTYNETRVKLVLQGPADAKGEREKTEKVLSEADATRQIERINKDNEGKSTEEQTIAEIVAAQTFIFHEVETDQDFAVLVPNDAERANIINVGYVVKQQRISREILLEDDFVVSQDPYDLQADAAETRERKKMTPEEKALKDLMKLNPESLQKVMAQFQAVLGAQQAPGSAGATA